MKKILAMLLMTCLILTGCGGGGSSDSSATSTAAESDLEEIDIMLDWYIQVAIRSRDRLTIETLRLSFC